MSAVIAVNERSVEGVPEQSDGELVCTLLKTVHEIRRAIATHHRSFVRFAWPVEMWQHWGLPGRSHFHETFHRLRREQHELVALVQPHLAAGHRFDEDGILIGEDARAATEPFLFAGRSARGLRVARDMNGAVVSFDVAGWRQPRIPHEDGGVANAWSPEPAARREVSRVIGATLVMLPDYENPGHHDPTSPQFDPKKSEIPRRHERLLESALPADGRSTGTTWWAYCEHRFFHRFMGSARDGRPLVHWNGTTNPEARQNRDGARTVEEHVPAALREQLRSHLVVAGCKCREVRR